jgi:hypothetical protein
MGHTCAIAWAVSLRRSTSGAEDGPDSGLGHWLIVVRRDQCGALCRPAFGEGFQAEQGHVTVVLGPAVNPNGGCALGCRTRRWRRPPERRLVERTGARH